MTSDAHLTGSLGRSYYSLPAAATALERRTDAIRRVVPCGSSVLDLGCNDGRIARALLADGIAMDVTGVDLEDMVVERDPRLHVEVADLRALDPRALPSVDVALLLNVAHHLLDAGPDTVRRLIAGLLDRAPIVLVDMGSQTETGGWRWRQLVAQWWDSDEQMWADLFRPAAWRTPLLTYPFQGGRRTLWKLEPPGLCAYDYEVVKCYRRNVASESRAKRLIPVRDLEEEPVPFGDEPGQLCPDVFFRVLRRHGTQELFWAKQRTGGARMHPALTELEARVHAFLRVQPFRCSLPREDDAEMGLIFGFQQELFEGRAVHAWAHDAELSTAAAIDARRLGALRLPDGPFVGLPLSHLSDFQAIEHGGTLSFIDFEAHHEHLEELRIIGSRLRQP